ncbi:hypothetical protein EXIGLDRAFT_217232 [Exidia glandulosa HHB12029]|uniref:Uncharacterized protein n=1 Tax=Exidia glandulosa HHB12029 TaxID=1314781 RepID=A0A165EF49_EXIGL|nr:hypothetical protein EXIGLDRAFT_217232 [Exidia glandulosa HHB12029]
MWRVVRLVHRWAGVPEVSRELSGSANRGERALTRHVWPLPPRLCPRYTRVGHERRPRGRALSDLEIVLIGNRLPDVYYVHWLCALLLTPIADAFLCVRFFAPLADVDVDRHTHPTLPLRIFVSGACAVQNGLLAYVPCYCGGKRAST